MHHLHFSKIKLFLIFSVVFSAAVSIFFNFTEKNSAQSDGSDTALLREFSAWTEAYVRSPDEFRLDRGRALAERRREILERMITRDPKLIVENAIEAQVMEKLPPEIAQHLERPVSFYGDLEVYVIDLADPATGEPTGSRTERFVVTGGVRYPAVVYGRREGMTTKHNIPMHGVRIGDVLVLDEAPAKRLSTPGRAEPYQPVRAEIGGEPREFATELEYEAFIGEQIAWESKIGPRRPGPAARPNSSWTEGPKTALLIMVDFSDLPGMPKAQNGVPYTDAQVRQSFTQTVTPFYASNSYGKTSITMPSVTPVLRLPKTLGFYSAGTNYTVLIADARAAARAAGFDHYDFDFDMTLLSRTPLYAWSGIALGGSNGIAINGAFDFRVVSHELGHNYGLPHANRWQTNDGSVIGAGSMVEYGDGYDSMGTGGNHTTNCDFNTYYKHRLDWLTSADIKVANESGTYRIFAHDIAASAGIRALKIPRNSISDYWVEFRQMFPATPSLMDGATIRWEVAGASGASRTSQLLDATPQTSNNQPDHALPIGQTLTDDQNRVRIKILGKGNTTPESLDVQVEVNIGCTFSSVTSTATNFPASGGEGILNSATQSGCRIVPTSNAGWIVPIAGTGGTAGYVVTANYGAQPRTGTLTFNGQTITVDQAGSATQCAAQPPGIVAWWRGEGDTLDHVGSLHGTTLGGGYGAGRVGGGFSNSITTSGGAIGVRVPNTPVAALSESMTIEGWIKIDGLGFTQRVIVTEQPSYDVQISPEGILYFGTWRFDGTGYVGAAVGSDPLPTGQFIHFAGTLDDATGELKMYINGQFVSQIVTTERPMWHPSVALHIARMNGVADELSIYDRVLSPQEIAAVHAAGTAATGAAGKCLTASAPPVSVSGRVLTPFGQALRNAAVTLTDAAGARQTVTTSSFGVYTFSNVAVGTNYTLTVGSRRYRFSPRIMDIASSLTDIDLVGQE